MRLRHAPAHLLAVALLTACTSTVAAPEVTPVPTTSTPTPTVVTTPSFALQDLASALSDQGRGGPFTPVFGTLVLDGPANTVTLYATDEAEGRRLVAAAKAAQPEIDTSLVRIVRCPYSRQQIDAVMRRIMERSGAKALPFAVHEAAMAYGATGVKVGVESAGMDSPELRRALEQLADGVTLTLYPASPVSPLRGTPLPPTPRPGHALPTPTGGRATG